MATVRAIELDTTKSNQIVQRFQQSPFRSKRSVQRFSGTFETTVDALFPLFCPAREADWIPGWDAELVYTDSGYAEDNCIFRTDASSAAGDGLWVFTGFEANRFVEFVRVQEDLVTHARITVADNGDGTATATWNIVSTGLTEKGNAEVERMSTSSHSQPLVRMIEHYLKTGRTISRSALVLGVVTQGVRGHFS
jgi:hypothetical protein